MRVVPTALSVAGSDPSGGAGIQADLKVFLDHGVYGMAVITALTAQNTREVRAVHVAPPPFVRAQIQTLRDDMPIGAVKIGMLANAEVALAVCEALAGLSAPVVLDPVLIAKSNARLLDPAAEAVLRGPVVDLATLVTPNLPEAEVLLDGEAPEAWAARTGKALLLKDGHGSGREVADRLFLPDGRVRTWRHPRQDSRNNHGTGCTLSSAIAARLARGETLEAAVEGGLRYVTHLLRFSEDHTLGGGHGPLLHGEVGTDPEDPPEQEAGSGGPQDYARPGKP